MLKKYDRERISTWNSKLISEKTVISTIHEVIRSKARVRPSAVAIEDGREANAVNYGTLDQVPDQLADKLSSRGVSRSSVVAPRQICLKVECMRGFGDVAFGRLYLHTLRESSRASPVFFRSPGRLRDR